MRSVLMFFLLINSYSYAQNPIRFFERVPSNLNVAFLIKAKQNNDKYLSISSSSIAGKEWIVLDSLGHLMNKHYIDTFIHPDTVIDFGVGNHRLNFTPLNGKFYFPTFKYFLYSQFDRKRTAALAAVNQEGYLDTIYNYSFNDPAEYTYHTISTDQKLLACGRVYTDTISGPLICDALVAKIDTNGNELWHFRYTGPYAQDPGGIIATPDSGAIVVLASGPWPGVNEVRVIKLSKNGQLQWMKRPPLPVGINKTNLIDFNPINGDVVLSTQTYSDTLIIAKYDSSMSVQWEIKEPLRDAQGFLRFRLAHLIKDRTGYIACGEFYSGVNGTDRYGYLYKINGNGKPYWENKYKGLYSSKFSTYDTYFAGIDTMPDGGYVVCGYTLDSTSIQVGVILRVDEYGCLINQCDTKLFNSISESTLDTIEVMLFPNPTNDVVNMRVKGNTKSNPLKYVFTNILGEQVMAGKLNAFESSIDVSQLASGIYLVNVENSKGFMWNGKMIKE